jgi:hypothetical protein
LELCYSPLEQSEDSEFKNLVDQLLRQCDSLTSLKGDRKMLSVVLGNRVLQRFQMGIMVKFYLTLGQNASLEAGRLIFKGCSMKSPYRGWGRRLAVKILLLYYGSGFGFN